MNARDATELYLTMVKMLILCFVNLTTRINVFPGGPGVKNLPANAEDTGWFLIREQPTCKEQLSPCVRATKLDP